MRAVLKIAAVEKPYKSLSVTENVSSIGSWSAVLAAVEDFAAFAEVTVEREGVEIFGGRMEVPGAIFGAGGSMIKPSGYDYTVKLTDYLTPSSSIVDTATLAALTTLITNTPFTLSVDSTFSYITTPLSLDTTCEFLDFDFSNTCIEFENTAEQITEVDTDINTLPAGPEFRCSFWADTGTNTRFYIFYKSGGNLVYRFSADCGATWSAEQGTGPIALATAVWSIVWYDSKVYLLLEDAGGNTDFYRGTINDGTGVVTLALVAGNIFANPIRAGPIFDNDGDIWCIEETGGNGDVWESVNDGVAWNNRFTAQEVAKLLLPRESDTGDVWVVEHDTVNNDLKLWYWDASAGAPELFDSKIDDITNFGNIGGAQNADYTVHIAWTDNAVDLFYAWKTEAGAWSAVQTLTGGIAMGDHSFQISADRGVSAYLFSMSNFGVRCLTVKNGTASAWGAAFTGIGAVANGYVQSPQTGLWDGELATSVVAIDPDDDLWFVLLDPTGIRLDRGQTTGWFRTDAITSGAFIKWGYCVANGTQLTDTDWDVLKAADNTLLGDGNQQPPFDIDIATGGTTETSIKIRVDMTDAGTDPYVEDISVSEKIDEVTLDLDYEDVYAAMVKWALLSGGEFWLDGSDVLHVAATRGSDKSNLVVLKNAKTGLHPTVQPNIKIVSREPDWSSFVNALVIIGAGTGGARIEAELRDQISIDEYGAHWATYRDQDLQTVDMAETVGAVELAKRNAVIDRVGVEFLDVFDPDLVSIGDTVTVVAGFGDDEDVNLNTTMRIVSLTRTWDENGERVSAELINPLLYTSYWSYLLTVQDLTRWITA